MAWILGFGLIAVIIIGWKINVWLDDRFEENSKIHLKKDLTGAEVARRMLSESGIQNVQVTCVKEKPANQYDPSTRVVNLSDDVYNERSVAAATMAAHECGHAIQHVNGFNQLGWRTALIGTQNLSLRLMAGVLAAIVIVSIYSQALVSHDRSSWNWNLEIVILLICYSIMVVITLVTLPGEIDASQKAMTWMKETNFAEPEEYAFLQNGLRCASLMYFVATVGVFAAMANYVVRWSNKDLK